ncbi:acyltransferase [Caulobacter sp. S45]|uniref:acyltransferase family protein n=1 Tax=Caulobacter sp. S45 TaxID=1641861 RepID=UPI00131E5D00|nr:acyltransferase [Caulobacter sp. S45]
MSSVIAADDFTRKFHTLDGMRGVAAIAVVLRHVRFTGRWPIPGSYLAVDLFFVLSGFVLALSNDQYLAATTGQTWQRRMKFMFGRLVRLYPLYILGTAVGAAFLIAHNGVHMAAPAILLAALFLPAPAQPMPLGTYRGSIFPANFPAWSLFYELVANGVYALFARRLAVRILLGLLTVMAALLIFEAFKRGSLDLGSAWNTKAGGIIRVLFSFFAGVTVYKLWLSGVRAPRLPSWLLALLPFALFMIPGPRPIVDLLEVFIVFPLLVLAGACTEPTGLLRRLMVESGEVSYPLYVLQAAFFCVAALVAPDAFGHGNGPKAPAIAAAFMVGTPCISWAAYKFYDVPVRRWVRKSFPALMPKSVLNPASPLAD